MFHIFWISSTWGIIIVPAFSDYRCCHCDAIHWIEERWFQSSKTFSKFRYCQSEKIDILRVNETSKSLHLLFNETRINQARKIEWTKLITYFQQNIRVYNNFISFTSFDVKINELITNNNNEIYSLHIQEKLYHKFESLFFFNNQETRFVQI